LTDFLTTGFLTSFLVAAAVFYDFLTTGFWSQSQASLSQVLTTGFFLVAAAVFLMGFLTTGFGRSRSFGLLDHGLLGRSHLFS
jgi:hypothetical protein